jgi:hypothetical protein
MNLKLAGRPSLTIVIIAFGMLVACTSTADTQQNADSENPETGSGTLAMVDTVTVEQRDNHYYAVITGNYPDPCTYISSIEQIVEGDTISITLFTDSPADLMCAAVLTPFTVDVLLTTGGLMPQSYDVVVNDGPSTTFSLG